MPLQKNATQFEGVGADGYIDIVIGFDFGTSCTKVALQAPILRNAFAVPFGNQGHKRNIYLLPSKLGLTSYGECRLVEFNQRGIRGLKLALMKTPEKPINLPASQPIQTNALTFASAYIALVLQHVRLWFLKNFRDEYGRDRIRWYLNLGIPTPNYDDEKINKAFLKAARAGWWLSIQDGPVTIYEANKAIRKAGGENFNPGLHLDVINVVPEVAAEVASYARSPFRELGLHMIVDVGANTMDVATFRLEAPEDEFVYWFLYAEVCEYACYSIHSYRLKHTKRSLDNWLSELRRIDDYRAEIPQSHEDYLPPKVDLSDVDFEFINKAKGPVSRVAAISYTKRDPNAREWKTGVPLFLCGGGSNLSLFNVDLIKVAEKGLSGYKVASFKTRPLPKPDNFVADELDHRQYHRLAVSYGLSFFYDDIGRTVPPSDIQNIEKIERIKVVDYVGKEMV